MLTGLGMRMAGSKMLTYDTPPYLGIAFLLFFLVFMPVSVYTSSKKSYRSNLRIQEPMEYTFTADKIIVTGSSFNSERDWNQVFKIIELKRYFLIYENNMIFNMIPKSALSSEEIRGIREALRQAGIGGITKLRKG